VTQLQPNTDGKASNGDGTAQSVNLTDMARLADLLGQIEQELDASTSPHRIALGDWGMDRNGFVPRPYSDDAIHHWNQLLKQYPSDPITLHHCAIAKHAKAIDLEASDKPEDSDLYWMQAVEHWSALMVHEGFWESLARSIDEPPDAPTVTELRGRLPTMLLRIHLDIAYHNRTANHRAQFHIRCAKDSPLTDQCALEQAREQVYERFSKRFPEEVWLPGQCDPDVAARVCGQLVWFLEVDSGNAAASVDLLRLQMRLINSYMARLSAETHTEGGNREAVLRDMAGDAKRYGPYIAPLCTQLSEHDRDIAENLVHWHRLMGEVHEALDEDELAMKFYDAPPQDAALETDELARCCNGGATAQATLALRQAQGGKRRSALKQIAALEHRSHPPAKACLYAGFACLELKEYERAEQWCDRGEATATDHGDLGSQHAAVEEQMKMQIPELRQAILVRRAMEQSRKLMEKGEFDKALEYLDEAKAVNPLPTLLLLRAQCLDAKGRFADADAELDRVEDLLENEHDSLTVVKKIRSEMVQGREARVLSERIINTLKGRPSRLPATGSPEVFLNFGGDARDIASARSIVEEAVFEANDAAARKRLSETLTLSAVKAANERQKSLLFRSNDSDVLMHFVREVLELAVQLDDANTSARENLTIIRRMCP